MANEEKKNEGQEEVVIPTPQLKFQIPEAETVEAYLVRLKNGKLVVRTKEELEQMKKKKGSK
ncbi:hypothetical protein DRZ78_03070 [Candidatus Aerophobetes bacterium]|uniref:Uncharacterized protein n=1 Tax=Aerophobetes bacterium TaxID=2030807 RepID=A0A662D3K6_UNCAE|nr:MAG: hypothetical protein DRZ78_03070 [Candidatus Aerophobetes bacterium]